MPEKIENSFESTPQKPNIEKPERTSELFTSLTERDYFLYRQEIAQIPLLTQEEEKILVGKIKAAEEEVGKEKGEYDQKIIKEGNKAVNELVCANLRLVLAVINREYRGYREQFLDLLQIGNMALINAAKGDFDIERGVRFSTYAYSCIEKKIRTAVTEKQGIIRIPSYRFQVLNTYRKEEKEFREEFKIKGPLTEKEEETLIERVQRRFIKKYRKKIKKETIKETPQYFRPKEFISLDQIKSSFSGKKEISLREKLADTSSYGEDPGKELVGKAAEEITERILLVAELGADKRLKLSPEDLEIIKMRFGLGYPEHTLQAVGDKFGRTREAIRQRQVNIMKKIRRYLKQTGQFDKIKEEIK